MYGSLKEMKKNVGRGTTEGIEAGKEKIKNMLYVKM